MENKNKIGKLLTVKEIIRINRGLAIVGNVSMPYELSYKLSRQVQKISDVVEAYNKEVKKIQEKYQTEDPQSGQQIIDPDFANEFEAEVEKIESAEEKDIKLDNFDISEFKKVKSLPINFFVLCDKIIKDKTTKE